MSKELKGNAKKHVLLDRIKSNISKYNGQLCTYNVQGITANDFNTFKKKLPNDIKILTVPTKICMLGLKDTVEVSSAKLKGNICFAFSKDALEASSLSSLVPKSIRNEFVLSGITWNGKLETSNQFLDFLSTNKIFSTKILKERALFNIFKTHLQFKNLLKMRSDML